MERIKYLLAACAALGLFVDTRQVAGAVRIERLCRQQVLIAYTGVDQGVCYLCGRTLVNGRCPVHNPAESSGGGGGGGGSASISIFHRTVNYPSMPAVVPTPFQLQRQNLRKQAVDMNEAALQAMEKGHWDEAIGLFQRALDTYPDYDETRTKLRDNLEWAQNQEHAVVKQREESRLALSSARDLINQLARNVAQGYPWSLDEPSKTPYVQLQELSEAEKSELTEDALAAAKVEPRHLPLPTEVEQLDERVQALVNSKKLSAGDLAEYKQIQGQFEEAWRPLCTAYQEYMDANTEVAELTRKINAHNAEDPGEGAQLQKYNDDARMLVYQIAKVRSLLEQKRIAFMSARETLEPQVNKFLASGKLDQFTKRISAEQPMPTPRLPVVDPAKLAMRTAAEYKAPAKPGKTPADDELVRELTKHAGIEILECPALRGKKGTDYALTMNEIEEQEREARLKAERDLYADLKKSDKMRSDEITEKVNALAATLTSDGKPVVVEPSERFMVSAMAKIWQDADDNAEFRRNLLRKAYKNRIAAEKRRIEGWE